MGEPLVKKLANDGHEVYVTSRKIRKYSFDNIHCITGNAHNMDFLSQVLKERYDVLVDFMNYTFSELKERLDLILNSVGHYIFLSSCRVFARSDVPITENTPRLLDVCKDKDFLSSGEYSLTKAREENFILSSKQKNWTIIRPTVTYNSHRLQLGCYELKDWIYRPLNNRPLIFFDDLADKLTSMTYGGDVANGISYLIENPDAKGEVVNIASPESKTWNDILKIYKDVIDKHMGSDSLKIVMLPSAEECETIFGRKYRYKYNRIYNRSFDSSKMDKLSGGRMTYTPIKEGLENCLSEFLSTDHRFDEIGAVNEAYMDKACHRRTKLSAFSNNKTKVKYFIARYTPYLLWKKIRNKY